MEFSNFFEAQPTEVCPTECTLHMITGAVLLFQDETATARTRFCILARWFKILQIIHGIV